jgi:hypothetical protein
MIQKTRQFVKRKREKTRREFPAPFFPRTLSLSGEKEML